MSQYYDPNATKHAGDGSDPLNPASSYQGNSSPVNLSGVEIGIIVGALIAFLVVVGLVFAWRQREARRRAAPQAAKNRRDAELAKTSDDVSGFSDARASAPTEPKPKAKSWAGFLLGRNKGSSQEEERRKSSFSVEP
jgi:hypothetical protein